MLFALFRSRCYLLLRYSEAQHHVEVEGRINNSEDMVSFDNMSLFELVWFF